MSDQEQTPPLQTNFAEFISEHHQAVRRAGVVAMVGAFPATVAVEVAAETHQPSLIMMGIAGAGVISYSLGVRGRELAEPETKQPPMTAEEHSKVVNLLGVIGGASLVIAGVEIAQNQIVNAAVFGTAAITGLSLKARDYIRSRQQR